MVLALSEQQVRALRLHAQRLRPPPVEAWAGFVAPASLSAGAGQQHCPADKATSVADVVQALCGIQAQEAPAAALAVRVRSAWLTADDVERAQITERTVVRTWGMRNTLHLLAAADLGWLLALLGPVNIAGCQRRYRELGLDTDTLARGVCAICDVLEQRGPCTRAEIVEYLASVGIKAEGQAAPYLLNRAALEGMICLGPDRGAKPTYVLLSKWIASGNGFSPEVPLAELARRYLSAYGPATPADLAAWSGLPMSQIRAGWKQINDQLVEVEMAGASAWMLKERLAWLDEPPVPGSLVRLLPAFDTYLLGYQQRDLIVDPQHIKRINAGGGMLHPILLVDGRAVGTWKSKRHRDHLEVSIAPFEPLAPEMQAGLESEVADLACFLEEKVLLTGR